VFLLALRGEPKTVFISVNLRPLAFTIFYLLLIIVMDFRPKAFVVESKNKKV